MIIKRVDSSECRYQTFMRTNSSFCYASSIYCSLHLLTLSLTPAPWLFLTHQWNCTFLGSSSPSTLSLSLQARDASPSIELPQLCFDLVAWETHRTYKKAWLLRTLQAVMWIELRVVFGNIMTLQWWNWLVQFLVICISIWCALGGPGWSTALTGRRGRFRLSPSLPWPVRTSDEQQ